METITLERAILIIKQHGNLNEIYDFFNKLGTKKDYKLNDLKNLIAYGASPRASINLVMAAKARAFMQHRGYITPEDIRYIGADVLRHRIILTYEAEAEELSSEDIVQRLFESIEVP